MKAYIRYKRPVLKKGHDDEMTRIFSVYTKMIFLNFRTCVIMSCTRGIKEKIYIPEDVVRG